MKNILIIGNRNRKLYYIEHFLKHYALSVFKASDCFELDDKIPADHVEFIILTGSCGDDWDFHKASKLRSVFPDSKILGLFDRIDPDKERVLRSVGLIFLGSYDLFIDQMPMIIKPNKN